MPLALELVGVEFSFFQQQPQTIGKLQLAARAQRRPLQQLEDARRKNVAADHRQIGGRLFRLRLLHQIRYLKQPAIEFSAHQLGLDHAICRYRRPVDLLRGDDRAPGFFIRAHHLRQARRIGVDHVVGQQHRERLRAHQLARHQHRMSQPQGFFLPHVGHVDHV